MTLRHIVLFRFKPDTPADAIRGIEAAFAALQSAIAEVRSLEWGINVSPEGLDQGYSHCFTVGFADATARDRYLVHPAHQAFVQRVQPLLDSALVHDHFIQNP